MSDEKETTMFLKMAPAIPRAEGADGDAVLLLIYPPGPGMGRRFALTGREHLVGRLPDLDVALEGEGLSRRHARIFRDDHGWQVEDLGSTNGVYVNDVKVQRQALGDGDLVRFGVAICKFLAGDNVEAHYHEEIYRMSIIDGLTGVHNKRHFLEVLERELGAAVRHGTALALIMIDIDHFKQINDTHGHLAGDAALKELCRRLRPAVGATALLARYGGEEFAAVLPATDHAGALAVAEALRAAVAAGPFQHGDLAIPATISLGVACVDHAAPGQPVDLIKRADEQLYAAKRAGRNRVMG
ncbi:MAG: GGDEF domain-containing protein [Kofleriaceae bacterium]